MSDQFLSYVQGNCYMKTQNNAFGKSQDYNIATSRNTSTSWKLVEVSIWQKKTAHYSNYVLLTRVQSVLTFVRTILATCSRHRLYLHLSCLKLLTNTYQTSPTPKFCQSKRYLAANTLPHLRLSLIALRKDTSCHQVSQKKHLIRIRWIS